MFNENLEEVVKGITENDSAKRDFLYRSRQAFSK